MVVVEPKREVVFSKSESDNNEDEIDDYEWSDKQHEIQNIYY